MIASFCRNSADSNSSHEFLPTVVELEGPLFKGLGEKVTQLQNGDKYSPTSSEASLIAHNAGRTLTDRYMTPAATMCYIRAAIASYNSVLVRSSWPTAPNGETGPQLIKGGGIKPGAGSGKKPLKAMGLDKQGDIPVETWNLLNSPNWPPA